MSREKRIKRRTKRVLYVEKKNKQLTENNSFVTIILNTKRF